jgi:hypothetical protein
MEEGLSRRVARRSDAAAGTLRGSSATRRRPQLLRGQARALDVFARLGAAELRAEVGVS